MFLGEYDEGRGEIHLYGKTDNRNIIFLKK